MKTLILALIVVAGSSAAAAQTSAPPTKTPTPMSAAQESAIRAGIALHDQGKYDEAIARYEAVLADSPDNVTALFELALSQLAKDDHQKVLEIGRRGAEYKSDLLPMFYDVMGSALDAMGQSQQAIDTYKQGIALVPDAGLYYNMAVTYHESLKDARQARLALEQSVRLDPDREEASLLLGQLFQSGGYRTQALLALARYLILDPAGNRSLQAYGLWRGVLRGSADTALAGAMRTPDAPIAADEGNFASLDKYIDETNKTATAEMDKGGRELEVLVTQLDTWLGRLVTDGPATRGSFAGDLYVPYFIELKQKNFVEPFVYWVSQRAPLLYAREWVDGNRERVQEFLRWSNQYRW
jgi:tetratricopeptide (TPR) repeat protein